MKGSIKRLAELRAGCSDETTLRTPLEKKDRKLAPQPKSGKTDQQLRNSATRAVGKEPERDNYVTDAEFNEAHEYWEDMLQRHRCERVLNDPAQGMDHCEKARYIIKGIDEKWAQRDAEKKAAPAKPVRGERLPDRETMHRFYLSTGRDESGFEQWFSECLARCASS